MGLLASAILCGCGPRPLPPLTEPPVPVVKTSKCHGLDTAFRWSATRVGGDKTDEYYRLRWGYRFVDMFGFIGYANLKRSPAYTEAVLEPDSSELRVVAYDEAGLKLAEVSFPHARLLECGATQSLLSFDDTVSSPESGRTSKRMTITFTKAGNVTLVHTRVEAEHAWLIFQSAKQWEYWGDFEPAN